MIRRLQQSDKQIVIKIVTIEQLTCSKTLQFFLQVRQNLKI